ncbi:LysR substrate-binding domain-containing protein (plasmid) [Serratia sp. L9]|uniref:LysR substrate-binding domain-containing protein n=1 Tax=Serratia sp. L9 TaxID=3423946 RepID=UPI003D679E52
MTLDFCIMGRKGHPLINSQSLDELQGAKWFLPAVNAGYYINIEDLIFPGGNANDNVVIYGDSLSVARKLVFEHDFLFAGPKCMLNEVGYQGVLDIIPIREKLPDGQYSLVYHKSQILTPIAAKLIKEILYSYGNFLVSFQQ